MPIERVVAAVDLPAGTPISTMLLASREFSPASAAPPGISPDELDQLTGGVLTKPIAAGEPVAPNVLTWDPSEAVALALQPGQRAVTLRAGPPEHDPGLVLPGSRVDLVLVTTAKGDPTLLLEDVRILAVNGSRFPSGGDNALNDGRSLTFAISPSEADRVAEAARRVAAGEQILLPLLRNPSDNSLPRLPVAPTPPTQVVALIEGGNTLNGTLIPRAHRFGPTPSPKKLYGARQ